MGCAWQRMLKFVWRRWKELNNTQREKHVYLALARMLRRKNCRGSGSHMRHANQKLEAAQASPFRFCQRPAITKLTLSREALAQRTAICARLARPWAQSRPMTVGQHMQRKARANLLQAARLKAQARPPPASPMEARVAHASTCRLFCCAFFFGGGGRMALE